MNRKDGDVQALKTEKRKLVDENLKLQRNVLELERRNGELQLKLENDEKSLENMEKNQAFLFQRNEELSKQLAEAQRSRNDDKRTIDTRLTDLITANQKLRDNLAGVLEDAKRQSAAKDLKITELTEARNSLTGRVHECEKQVRHATELAHSRQSHVDLMNTKLADCEAIVRQLRSHQNVHDDLNTLRKQLSEQTSYIRKMEDRVQKLTEENRYYRQTQESIDVLREQKASQDRQLALMDTLRTRLATLEVEVTTLRGEKAQWKRFLEDKDESGMDSPYALSKALARQRLDFRIIRGHLDEEIEKRNRREENLARVEEQLRQMAKRVEEMEAQHDRDERTIKRLEKSKSLSQKETEFLREQLRSYDLEEVTMTDDADTAKLDRLARLEELLEEHKQRITELEQELQNFRNTAGPPPNQRLHAEDVASARKEIMEKDHAIRALEAEKVMLEREVTSLDQQVTELLADLGRGEYNPKTTRILQLADNPEAAEYAIRAATLAALKAENDALRKQLLEGTGIGARLLPVETYQALQVQCEKLERGIAEEAKKSLRLREVFQVKANEIREVVLSLFGYRLDIELDGRVRLTSKYVKPEELSMVFNSGENNMGTMEINGTTSQLLNDAREHYVTRHESIPAFLGFITLELFRHLEESGGSG
ncbi:coiled-coil domain-containing protein mad1 [Rhizophlyctis rosea]|uniref:Spindle assembly checkpoint component MAD1 n=1 Tax=Rhizophlyctis rosea TaxID=64517 RepID=A0AAD5SQD9_9FUNG|nr:coiled-coil domain-containing protein mad1 [Rhizophlyctis rosea]